MNLLNQKFAILILLFSSLVIFQAKISGQTKTLQTDDIINYGFGPQNCEALRRNLESFLIENEKITPITSLIIIFRMEKGEGKQIYTNRKKELSYWLDRNFKAEYLIALGENVKKTSRADVYADGKILVGFGFKKHSRKICQ